MATEARSVPAPELEMERMKSLRIIAMSVAALFAVASVSSQGLLDRKPKPSNDQGRPARPDPKPSTPPPREDPKPAPRPDPKPEQRPQPKPRNDPPDQGPRPRNDDQRPQPKPRNDPPDLGPRPRNDDQRPQPKPRNDPPDLGPRPRNDDQRPRPGDNTGPRPPDRLPTQRDNRNPRIYDPPKAPNGEPIGRIERGSGGNNGGRNDGMLGRKGGSNAYGGSVSNQNRGERGGGKPIDFGRAPVDIFRGGLEHQVRREDNPRIVRNNWRSGYYHYRRDWCDDYFWFSGYVFDPFRSNCYVSPWYYYGHLPAYVSPRCAVVLNLNFAPWRGSYYSWNRPVYYDNSRSFTELDYAVDDITRAFENMDRRALRRLIPYRERIAIFVDGQYSYSMNPDDFEDFMLDAIEDTATRRYEIVRVERYGREAEVQARHEYDDAWGRRVSLYHTYHLVDDGRGYVITRFGTSYYR